MARCDDPHMSASGPENEPLEMPLATSEPVGGLLALEAGDELALGDPDDYGEILELGEAGEDDAMFALDFGAEDTFAGGAGWDLGDIQELVVNEAPEGDFAGDPYERGDVTAIEDFFFDDEDLDAMVVAVFQGEDGKARLERRVKLAKRRQQVLLPYGLIAAGLLVLGGIALVGVVLVIATALMAPTVSIDQPLDRSTLPKVEIDRTRVEKAKQKTADEILQEVLGDEDGEKADGE